MRYKKCVEVIGEWFPDGRKDTFEVTFKGRLVGKCSIGDEPNFNSQYRWWELRVYELPSKSLVMFAEVSDPSSIYGNLVTFSTYDTVEDLQDEAPSRLVDQVRKAISQGESNGKEI